MFYCFPQYVVKVIQWYDLWNAGILKRISMVIIYMKYFLLFFDIIVTKTIQWNHFWNTSTLKKVSTSTICIKDALLYLYCISGMISRTLAYLKKNYSMSVLFTLIISTEKDLNGNSMYKSCSTLFWHCYENNSVESFLEHWNTEKVIHVNNMYKRCSVVLHSYVVKVIRWCELWNTGILKRISMVTI